ncbi:hypothetical protein EC835_105211 [Providencia alcalifaciens]|uniref:Uncharacterized protein n=1 Tax=Providencia alcalifaciens TaxID=126385 RepID=A0A4R3NIF7_9GAMM|nr:MULTISPECIES: hypothetical protein [Providencia]MBC5792000.1 hypothetical protein [Providencia sp. JUb39]TCT34491.1 hypothetical protein EC835_105211 [Providencia alcalifaciens]
MRIYKKIIKLILKSSLFVSFLALIANWFYLNKIGWLSLFLSSMASKDSLFIIAFFLTISFFSMALIFLLPSINIIMFLNKDDEYILKYNEVRMSYTKIFFIIATFSNLFFILSVFFNDGPYSFYINISLILLVISYGWYLYVRGVKKIVSQDLSFKQPSKAKWKEIEIYVIIPFVFLLTLTLYSFSFYMVTNGVKSNGESVWIQVLYLFSVFELTIFISVVPCFVYFSEVNKKGWLSTIITISPVLILFVFIIPIFVPSIPSLVINATMKFSGVMDENPHVYLVDENSYPEKLFNLDLWNKRILNDSNKYTIDGVSMYSFGETNLVCPKSIIIPYKNSLSNYIYDNKEDGKTSDELKKSAQSCIPFDKKALKIVG